MKTIINKEEMRKEWILGAWFEKTLYVFGWVSFVYFAFFFSLGFLGELFS